MKAIGKLKGKQAQVLYSCLGLLLDRIWLAQAAGDPRCSGKATLLFVALQLWGSGRRASNQQP